MTNISAENLMEIIKINPNDEQIRIIESKLQPGLVIAGAGSGKTTTMAARVAYLIINDLVTPERILGLTFSRKAAAELSERIEKFLSILQTAGYVRSTQQAVNVSTYHAYANRIVNEYGLRCGIEIGSDLSGDSRVWQLAQRLVSNYEGELAGLKLTSNKVTSRVIDLLSEILEHGADLDAVRNESQKIIDELLSVGNKLPNDVLRKCVSTAQERIALLPLVEQIIEQKDIYKIYSYDDMMSSAAKISHQLKDFLEIHERSKYDAVILDEYQDTSASQLALLQNLYAGKDFPVMAVGDPNQSIYAWRGAAAKTIERFSLDFPCEDKKDSLRFELLTSWRSDQRIIEVANRHIHEHLQGSVPDLQSRVDAPEGEVIAKVFASDEEEADFIAREMKDRWSAQGESTAAILVRSRSQMPLLIHALRTHGLPVYVSSFGGLLAEPEIADIRATLDVLVNIEAGDSMMRILTSPRWNFSARDLTVIGRFLRKRNRSEEEERITLIEALDEIENIPDLSPDSLVRFTDLKSELNSLRREIHLSIPELIFHIYEVQNLGSELAIDSSNNRLRNVMRLVEEAINFGSGSAGIRAFLNYLNVAAEQERGLSVAGEEVVRGAIQIMTVHGAKGLEWDLVAVPGLSSAEGSNSGKSTTAWIHNHARLPYPLRLDREVLPKFAGFAGMTDFKSAGLVVSEFIEQCRKVVSAEEMRLAYVAFTRAKHLLIVTSGDGEKALTESSLIALVAGIPVSELQIEEYEHALAERSAFWPAPKKVLSENIRQSFEKGRALTALQIEAMLEQSPDLLRAVKALNRTEPPRELFPQRFSVSALVSLASDAEYVRTSLRRPMPSAPLYESRRGTAFHLWLEEHLQRPALLDLDEDDAENLITPLPAADLKLLQDAWLASEWSTKSVHEVEVPFELNLGGIVVVGRIDAIYRENNQWLVVDWKTGKSKQGEELREASVQLAIYRLAWAALMQCELTEVSAAFHYVLDKQSITPVDLMSESELIKLIREFQSHPE